MNLTKTHENHIASFVMVAAMCFTFLAFGLQAAHAQEEVVEEDAAETEGVDKEKRTAMMEQIESLRAMVAERKSGLKEDRQERVAEVKEEIAEKKAEHKLDRADFMSSLEGLDEDEKRSAMMEFIANIRATIEARKAEMSEAKVERQEERTENKEERVAEREAFKLDVAGLTGAEKLAAIMERVAEIKQQIQDKMDAEEDEEVENDEEESEDEDVDEEDDEEEGEDDEEDDEDDEEVEDEV
jgi:uncharacterized membrane protein YccC